MLPMKEQMLMSRRENVLCWNTCRYQSSFSLSLCRLASFALTRQSGQQMSQPSSKKPGGDSALTSMTGSSVLHPSSASCRRSWALTRPSIRKWPLARELCRPTCARTEKRTPAWPSRSVLSRGLWQETAAFIWTASVRTMLTDERSLSSKI